MALVATVLPAVSVPVTDTGEPLYLRRGGRSDGFTLVALNVEARAVLQVDSGFLVYVDATDDQLRNEVQVATVNDD